MVLEDISLPSGENLYSELCKTEVLLEAWNKVKEKGSAGGIDGIGVEDFEKNIEAQLNTLSQDLIKERYLPEPYKIVKIPKGSDEFRLLSLPSVRDKVVQQAVRELIEPLLEKTFLDTSYAYRKNKGPLKALSRVSHLINNEKREWVTLCDIDSYFDSIEHGVLFDSLSTVIRDSKILSLIKLWIRMGRIEASKKWVSMAKGIPQGGIISPLLANFYLNPLDSLARDRRYGYVRYADDFIILCKYEEEAYRALQDVKVFLEKNLKLSLNPGYTVKNVSEGFEFLGICFKGSQRTIKTEKLDSLKAKITDAVNSLALSNPNRMKEALNGIRRYYGQVLPQEYLEEFDQRVLSAFKELHSEAPPEQKKQTAENLKNILYQIDFFSSKFQLFRKRILKSFFSVAFRKRPKGEKEVAPKPFKRDPVKLKKREYQKREEKDLELVVTQLGVSVGKSKRGIVLKDKGVKIKEISTINLRGITILSPAVGISSRVIRYCAENKIPIDFIGFDGKPYAKIYSLSESKSPLWMVQLKASEGLIGQELAKCFVLGKVKNQANLIKYFTKYRKLKDGEFLETTEQKLKKIDSLIKEIEKIPDEDLELVRGKLFSIEGRAAAIYWQLVEDLLKEDLEFQGRVRKGATDLLNSLLNYGYGILYSKVWGAVLKAGLNPFISFLHKPQEGKPTLVFDLIEEFRQQAVDRTVFALVTKGKDLRLDNGLLDQETKKIVAEKVLQRLYTVETFRRSEVRLIDIIHEQAHSLADFLLNQEKKYRPYLGKW